MRLSFIICYKKHHLHSFYFMFHKRSYIKCYIFDPGKLQWPLLPANKHNMTWIGDEGDEGGDGWGIPPALVRATECE